MTTKKPESINRDDDVPLTIRLTLQSTLVADKVVAKARKANLQVQGHVNPIAAKHSHVYKLAVELGMPLVLKRLHELDADVKRAAKEG